MKIPNMKTIGLISLATGGVLFMLERMTVPGTGNMTFAQMGSTVGADAVKPEIFKDSSDSTLVMLAQVESVIPGLAGRKSYTLLAAGAALYWMNRSK